MGRLNSGEDHGVILIVGQFLLQFLVNQGGLLVLEINDNHKFVLHLLGVKKILGVNLLLLLLF